MPMFVCFWVYSLHQPKVLSPEENIIPLSTWNWRNLMLKNFPSRLDHFLNVGCCPAATCSHFTVCLTAHIDTCIWYLEDSANHIFRLDKHEAHWAGFFPCWRRVVNVLCGDVFFQPALLNVHGVHENELKRELLMERNAPRCALDPTRVMDK